MSDSCFISLFKHLKDREKVSFIIPQSVYYESVECPLKIKRFELNAIRIKNAVDSGFLEVAKTTPQIKNMMNELSTITANLCKADGREITLINKGEAETLALMKEINSRILLIDERTTRMIIEEPQNVMSFLQHRHKCKITLNKGRMDEFKNFFTHINVIRSVELIALAYEDGAFEMQMKKSKQALEASLFSAKYGGCAVSAKEIQDYLKGVKV